MATTERSIHELRKHARQVLDQLIEANKPNPPSEAVVQSWIALQSADGSFTDLAYPLPSRPVVDVSILLEHLERLSFIASFCYVRQDTRYSENVATGLRFYATQDYKTQNWWFRNIGLAKHACVAAMLVSRHLFWSPLQPFIEYMADCTNLDAPMTGGNRSDYALVQLMWASVGNDRSMNLLYMARIEECFKAVSALCFPVPRQGPPHNGEGIVSDLSFSQHNVGKSGGEVYHQIYSASYGTEMLKSIFRFMAVASGPLSLHDDAQNMVEKVIIDGLGWMNYGAWFDGHVSGRGIAGPTKHAGEIMSWARVLLGRNPQQPEVLDEIVQRIEQRDETRNAYYIGSRYFWINEFLCHVRPNFYLRTKNISTRTVGSESGNGGNLKGYYMGNGTTFFGTRGDEYKDIQVVWDWQRLPGTTVEQVPDFKFPLIEWGKGAWGSSDYSGGVWSQDASMASMILSKGAVANARKSVFAFRGRAFFLGSGIDTSAAVNPVVTTVNQCSAADSFQQRAATATSLEFAHDGLVYRIQKNDNEVTGFSQAQQGRWRDIDSNRSDELITRQVFSLQLEHPRSRNAVYAYEVRPEDVAGPQVQMHYDEKMHLVRGLEEQFLLAALFDTTNMQPLVIKPGLAFTSSVPILLCITYEDGDLHISCADPRQQHDAVKITFYDQHNAEAGDLSLEFKRGEFAGSTTTAIFQPR